LPERRGLGWFGLERGAAGKQVGGFEMAGKGEPRPEAEAKPGTVAGTVTLFTNQTKR